MKALPFLRAVSQRSRISLTLFLLFPWHGLAQQPGGLLHAPGVRITSPANHATFYAPVDIPLFAYAGLILPNELSPGLGLAVTNVEFFAGTNDLGLGFNLGSTVLPLSPIYANIVIGRPILRLGKIFCLTWSNAPPGTYALTAVGKAADGLSRTSPPVNITILTSVTNTNPGDVVSLVATDPIAIAGTNFWVWRGETNAIPAWTNWTGKPFGWFTNWGPKDALFTVRRFGDASSSLNVTYRIGGTASNGVDYATLPGSVTIPAGGAYALIPIVPIDSGSSNFSKTVILTISPSTDVSLDYGIGFPPFAEALILENWLRVPPIALPDGTFHLSASGPDGAWFFVQYSTDFVNWSDESTNQVFQGSIDFVDPDAPNNSSRFYRVVPVDSPPAE